MRVAALGGAFLWAAGGDYGFRLRAFGFRCPRSTKCSGDYYRGGHGVPGRWNHGAGESDHHVAGVCDGERSGGGGGSKNAALGASGALSIALLPNAGATPAGVYYTVVYQIGSGQVKTEDWVVPTSSPANLATVRTTLRSGVAGEAVSLQYVNSALAKKANDSAVVDLGGTETISSGKSAAKKDAAMSFLESALATVDAVAQREIVDPDKFKMSSQKILTERWIA